MPRKGYVPKVLSTPFRSQVITLSAFTQSEPVDGENPPPQPLCPVRALRIYVERTKNFRLSEQLFVCYGGCTKGLPISKQRLSHWVVDTIGPAYDTQNTNCPIGVHAHATRSIDSSWAWARGISMEEICSAAGWASQNTFARFYNLDVSLLTFRVHSVQKS